MSDLLDRPIAFHPALARATGSIEAGILLSQFLYWHKRSQHDGNWFWCTQADIEEQTCLSFYHQKQARATLVRLGFLKEDHRGTPTPATLWFQIQEDEVLAACGLQNSKKREIEIKKPLLLIKEDLETTTETTNTKSARAKKFNWDTWDDLHAEMQAELRSLALTWTDQELQDTVDLALSHPAARKPGLRVDLYLKGWIRRDRNGNGATARYGGTRSGGGHRGAPPAMSADGTRVLPASWGGIDMLEGLPK